MSIEEPKKTLPRGDWGKASIQADRHPDPIKSDLVDQQREAIHQDFINQINRADASTINEISAKIIWDDLLNENPNNSKLEETSTEERLEVARNKEIREVFLQRKQELGME